MLAGGPAANSLTLILWDFVENFVNETEFTKIYKENINIRPVR